MNRIELMLEAIRQVITVMEIDTPNSDVLDLCYKSLSEGEAELQRRQDAINAVEFWISCDTDKRDAYCALLTLLKDEIK